MSLFPSNLTNNEIALIKSRVNTITIPAGTILFRSHYNGLNNKNPTLCKDTEKKGVYFSNGIITPLGMILEYKTPLYLSKYKTLQDIEVYYGKYSFRDIEPETFYDSCDDYSQILYHRMYDARASYKKTHPVLETSVGPRRM